MTTTTDEAFEELDENLKLDPKERTAAQDCHSAITQLLLRVGIIVTAFLQGSFARKTMLAPLRDVDKVVVLAPAMAGLSADEVMDRIEDAVAEEYPEATFERSRHALKIDSGPDSFYFDTVPAWETTTEDDDVLIANREAGSWERSNTRELIRTVADRNAATDGRFIHQVRMAKQVISHLLDGLVPGLHVESWAYAAVDQALPHDEALARILEAGTELLGGPYTEPTGVDEISARLKPHVVFTAQPVLAEAARKAREARALADAGDHGEAIRIWRTSGGLLPGRPAPGRRDCPPAQLPRRCRHLQRDGHHRPHRGSAVPPGAVVEGVTTMGGGVMGMDAVLRHPHQVAEWLRRPGLVYGLVEVDVRVADRMMAVFWLTLEPWAPMAERGYPIERVSITVWAG